MLKKFLRETSGNIMIMSAAAIGPMAIAAGVGIDMAERYRATQSYQAAVDAAALAAAKVLSTAGDNLAEAQAKAVDYGTAVFNANIQNLPNSTGTITIQTGNGDCTGSGIVADATLSHPMLFDGIHKYFAGQGTPDYMNISVSSTVQCGNDTVEIAMVLDNSGSMEGGKLTSLKAAAKDLVASLNTSMQGNPKPEPLKFSLVPFSSMVNVGPENAGASWMDTQGASSIHHEHLDWAAQPGVTALGDGRFVDSAGNPLTRFRLYDELGIAWKGCVESRPWPLHTQDDPATNANPDSLIVPSFAPDTPDNFSGTQEWISSGEDKPIHCKKWKDEPEEGICKKFYDPAYPNNTYTGSYHPIIGTPVRELPLYKVSNGKYIGPGSNSDGSNGPQFWEETYDNNYIKDNHNMPKAKMHRFPEHSGTGTHQYSRQKWTWKYFNNPQPRTDVVADLVGLPGGPNALCSAVPLTELTASKSDIDSAIGNMVATGATNIQAGISWGWKTLSEAEPFTEGRSSTKGDNRKIMIVMTDGANTYYESDRWDNVSNRNPAYYSAFAHSGGKYGADNGGDLPRRIFEGYTEIANPSDSLPTYTKAMNSHMKKTCENARNDGIKIYSIAFEVTDVTTRNLMEDCASTGIDGSPLYYNATDSDKLKAAFKSIAKSITALAITK